MKVEVRHYSDREKRVLASMILDTKVLGPVASKWKKPGLFKSVQGNRIAKLLLQYYKKHKKAPKKTFRTILIDFLEDQNQDKLLEAYASELLDVVEHSRADKHPTNYYLEAAGRHFNSVRLLRVKELVDEGTGKNGELTEDIVTRAEELLQQRIQVGGSTGIYPLSDEELDLSDDEEDLAVLFRYQKDLGRFFGDEFYRGAFVSLLSGPKVGKSWWLIDIVHTALSQGCRVHTFELGDLGKKKHKRYLNQRITGRPKAGKDGKFRWPIKIITDERNGAGSVKYKLKDFESYTTELVKKKRDALLDDPTMLKSSYFHSSDFNIGSLRSELDSAEQDGLLPDVVIVDYADLLVPPGTDDNRRLVIDDIWKELRRLALELDCCLVTATQTSRMGYGNDKDTPFWFGPEHFSDARSKNDHVTAMIGLNQTVSEKENGIWRLNFVDRREDFSSRKQGCYVAGNLGLGRPNILSLFDY